MRFATWKDPQANEDGPVVTAFEKKYGIKVQVDMVAQTNYIQTLTSMIAAKDAPDICFDNNEFPASFSRAAAVGSIPNRYERSYLGRQHLCCFQPRRQAVLVQYCRQHLVGNGHGIL